MFSAMMMLSFPSSLLSVLAALLFFKPAGLETLPVYFSVWLILMAGGYLQWFVIVPKLFEKDQPILLNLGFEKIEREAVNQPTGRQPVQNQPEKRKQRQKRGRTIRAFDRQGRTPLERALGRRS
jgi:hypothetical protein